jgi:hypothetical protein
LAAVLALVDVLAFAVFVVLPRGGALPGPLAFFLAIRSIASSSVSVSGS